MQQLVALAGANLSIEALRAQIGGAWASKMRRDLGLVLSSLGCSDTSGGAQSGAVCYFDFDCCWSEMSILGESDLVPAVLDVLAWPDLTAARLTRWLGDRSWLGRLRWPARRRRNAAAALTRAGILCDTTAGRLETVEDLDRLCVMGGFYLLRHRVPAPVSALPFRVRPADTLYMRTKALAMWSTWSNALLHASVLARCEQRAVESDERASRGPLSIVAAVHLARRDYRAAAPWLRRYLAHTPVRWRRGERCPFTHGEAALILLSDLSKDVAPLGAEPPANPKALALACAERVDEAGTYVARRRFTASDKADHGIEWTLLFESPDRCHVTQDVIPAGDSDEWISIGSLSHRKIGVATRDQRGRGVRVWMTPAKDDDGDARVSRSLLADRYVRFLRSAEPVDAETRRHGDTTYVLLRYPPTAGAVLVEDIVAPGTVVDLLELWIDERRKGLSRVDIRAHDGRTGTSVQIEHLFAAYDTPLSVRAP